MSMWYNQPAAIAADQVLAALSNSGVGAASLDIVVYNSDKLVRAEAQEGGTDDDTAKSSTTVGSVANTWFHILGVYGANNARTCYVNGANPGSSSVTVNVTGLNTSTIGGTNNTGGPFSSNATFAFFAFYNIALIAQDALSLASGAHPRKVRPGNLLSIVNLTGSNNPEPDYVANTTWAFVGTGVPSEVANPRIYW